MSSLTDPPCANILVVDDEPHNLKALQALLCGPDRNVVTAASAGRPCAGPASRLRAHPAGRAHAGDGRFETAALIRKLKRSRNTPIVFLTAADEHTEWVLRGYEVGGVDYIFKPVDPEVLKSKVAVLLTSTRGAPTSQRSCFCTGVRNATYSGERRPRYQDPGAHGEPDLGHDRLRREMQMRERADAELLVPSKQPRRPIGRSPSFWPT